MPRLWRMTEPFSLAASSCAAEGGTVMAPGQQPWWEGGRPLRKPTGAGAGGAGAPHGLCSPWPPQLPQFTFGECLAQVESSKGRMPRLQELGPPTPCFCRDSTGALSALSSLSHKPQLLVKAARSGAWLLSLPSSNG